MSVTTTSGRSRSIAARSESTSSHAATISTLGEELEQLLKPFANDQRVFSDDDADGHRTTIKRQPVPAMALPELTQHRRAEVLLAHERGRPGVAGARRDPRTSPRSRSARPRRSDGSSLIRHRRLDAVHARHADVDEHEPRLGLARPRSAPPRTTPPRRPTRSRAWPRSRRARPRETRPDRRRSRRLPPRKQPASRAPPSQ